jgi:hypothetical protein
VTGYEGEAGFASDPYDPVLASAVMNLVLERSVWSYPGLESYDWLGKNLVLYFGSWLFTTLLLY